MKQIDNRTLWGTITTPTQAPLILRAAAWVADVILVPVVVIGALAFVVFKFLG